MAKSDYYRQVAHLGIGDKGDSNGKGAVTSPGPGEKDLGNESRKGWGVQERSLLE